MPGVFSIGWNAQTTFSQDRSRPPVGIRKAVRGDNKVSITRTEVLKIADLAKLYFSEEELDAFTAQFQRILEYVEQLKQVNVEAVEPTSHVSLAADFGEHIFREDEVKPSLPVEESLANAPDPGSGHFRVPKVL
jgi:aspartyl-tRNA(Asn)/glutamyl-tRNA(Gln) amidotransferase subunit C